MTKNDVFNKIKATLERHNSGWIVSVPNLDFPFEHPTVSEEMTWRRARRRAANINEARKQLVNNMTRKDVEAFFQN